jgi:pimeloyl-ACP methyl ester carboxylesterase
MSVNHSGDQKPGEVRSVWVADGACLEYEVVGNGPPLVMLHGFLASRFTFSRQRNELADRHRLIMVSARGHDGSENRLPANYGVGASDVDDVLALLDTEQLDRVSLFGHSSGGATAFMIACRYPDRVARAILIEPTLFTILPSADRDPLATKEIAATAEADGPEAGLRAAIKAAVGEAWSRLDTETQAKRLQALASSAPMVGPHMRGLHDLLVTEADICNLRPPTMLFYGADSYPFEAIIADRFRALRPDLQVITVEGAGHNVHRDRADIVNPAVLSFLAA